MAVQPALGVWAQRRNRNDPDYCFDPLVARVRVVLAENPRRLIGTSQPWDLVKKQ